jgi:hypothetical protein
MNKKLAVILLVGSFVVSRCTEPITEEKDTIYSAQDNSNAETLFCATYDVIYDVVSTNAKLRKANSTILPASTTVIFEDTSFTDGDGVSLTIDFGPLGDSEPKGTLCHDGIYRAGKLHISANSKFTNPNIKVEARIDESDMFFSGNGSQMTQVIGTTTMTKSTVNTLKIVVSDARIIIDDYELLWECSREIELVSDMGPGIWGDIYQVAGSSSGVNRFGEDYSVNIDEPLVKKMKMGCAQTFISGKLSVSVANSNKVIRVNYDPYGDGSCDLYAEADIQGRKTIFVIR